VITTVQQLKTNREVTQRMSRPGRSQFRDALQVSPERIAYLDDAELSELMIELLRAQAHRCGSPLSEIRVNTEDKAKDDGCDGWTAMPATKDDWLGDADTCWQLKSGASGEPARLKGAIGVAEKAIRPNAIRFRR